MCWWNWKRVPPHLPYAKGPYVPGCVDLMTEYSEKGSFMRLYYPSSLSDIEECSSSWIPWIAHQRYIDGFSRLLNIWKLIVKFVLWFLGGDIKVPVAWNADLIVGGSKLPVIVFSHGLGGSRFLYSTLCAELASYGFLVAAVEHRDKSASATFYLESQDDLSPKWIDYQAIQLGAGHLTNRVKQVQQRASECVRAIDLLENINNGLLVKNVLAERFDLRSLKDRLDMSRLTMMGHSFGGATALLTLAQDARFRCGVILDAWMFPIKVFSDLPKEVEKPLLFVNTWTFHTSANYQALSKFIEESDGRATVFTIRKTTHESQTDTPHIIGHWLNIGLKKLPPCKASEINSQLILEFLRDKFGLEHEINGSSELEPYIVNYLVKWED